MNLKHTSEHHGIVEGQLHSRRSALRTLGGAGLLAAIAIDNPANLHEVAAQGSIGNDPSGTYDLVANGHEGELDIVSIDANGRISGSMFGDRMIGVWDSTAQMIMLTRIRRPENDAFNQIYTGYGFLEGVSAGSNHFMVLTGYFQDFVPGSSQRAVFGWYAKNEVVG